MYNTELVMKTQPENRSQFIHVAIDGPVAAGKSTIAKALAFKLGFLYVDTGAMYRSATIIAIDNGLDLSDEAGITAAVERAHLSMYDRVNLETGKIMTIVELNGQDISERIRDREVDLKVPVVSSLPHVREVLVKKQQEIARDKNVIMEGRAIASVVLPQAQLKIFLTAEIQERGERRLEQYRLRGDKTITIEEVTAELQARDEYDSNRATDPLQMAADAWLIDTTRISFDEVVEKIAERISEIK